MLPNRCISVQKTMKRNFRDYNCFGSFILHQTQLPQVPRLWALSHWPAETECPCPLAGNRPGPHGPWEAPPGLGDQCGLSQSSAGASLGCRLSSSPPSLSSSTAPLLGWELEIHSTWVNGCVCVRLTVYNDPLASGRSRHLLSHPFCHSQRLTQLWMSGNPSSSVSPPSLVSLPKASSAHCRQTIIPSLHSPINLCNLKSLFFITFLHSAWNIFFLSNISHWVKNIYILKSS